MGRMKDVFMAICPAFASSCPHCDADLSTLVDLEQLNKALDEVVEIARVNALQKNGLSLLAGKIALKPQENRVLSLGKIQGGEQG